MLGLLGEVRPQAPVTAIRLEVELRGAAGRQADLWRGGDAEREQVLAAAARLQRRYGETALRRPRLAVDPGDLPERRFHWDAPVPAAMAARPGHPSRRLRRAPSGRLRRPGGAVVDPAGPEGQGAVVPPGRVAAAGRGHPRPTPIRADRAAPVRGEDARVTELLEGTVEVRGQGREPGIPAAVRTDGRLAPHRAGRHPLGGGDRLVAAAGPPRVPPLPARRR